MPEYWGFYKRVEKKSVEKQRTRITKFGEILQGRNEPMMVKEPNYAKWREIVKNADTRTENGRFEMGKLAMIICNRTADMSEGGHRKLVAFITNEMNEWHPCEKRRKSAPPPRSFWDLDYFSSEPKKEEFIVELSPVQKALIDAVAHQGMKKQLAEAFKNRKPLYPDSMPSEREIERSELSREPEGGKPPIGGESAMDEIGEKKAPAKCVARAEEKREECGGAEKHVEEPKSMKEDVSMENTQATAYRVLGLLYGYRVLGSPEKIHVGYENSVLTVTGPFEDIRPQDELRCRAAVHDFLSARFGFLPSVMRHIAPMDSVWAGEKTMPNPDDPGYRMPCSYFKIKASARNFIIARTFELRLWGIGENEHRETMRYLECLKTDGQPPERVLNL